MARCLLIQSDLPKALWNHAVRTAAYIRNRSYNMRLNSTPYQLFTNRRPNIKNMHPFGTNCYAYKQNLKKLDEKADLGQFVGYDYNSPAYLIYFAKRHVIKKVRCVDFMDGQEDEEEMSLPIITRKDSTCDQNECQEKPNEETAHQPSVIYHPEPSNNNNSENSPVSSNNNESRYPSRVKRAPKYLNNYVTGNSSNSEDEYTDCSNYFDYFYRMSDAPSSYNEAISSNDNAQWKLAMEDEIISLQENDTYELVPRPDRPVIGGRWVYAKKNNDGKNIFKARFDAKGFAQILEVDFTETFSPTARLTSIRLLMDIAMNEELIVHSMDVKRAYLNANIDCEVFMEQPKGFITKSGDNDDLVLRLKKSQYGLKQSGRLWNNLLHSFLVERGFVRSESENCVYVSYENGVKLIIIIWVDDLIIAGSTLNAVEKVKKVLAERFKMKDFGRISEFLGIEFEFHDDHVKLHQGKYAEKVLTKFQMMDCNIKKLPCDPSLVKIDATNSEIFEDNTLYRSMVGSLVYLSSCTRPDLVFVVTKLSEKLENPTKAHFNACKYALRYVRGTMQKGLIYKPNTIDTEIKLTGYSDSDWGSSSDRKSFSGCCFQMSPDNSFISWKTKKQPTIALSTWEAEYIAANYALQEGLFLRQLLCDMKYPEKQIQLYVDNKGAIDLSKNPVHH